MIRFGLLVLCFSCATLVIPVAGDSGASRVILKGSGTATIDGSMSAGEWKHAGHHDFPIPIPGGGSGTATLFVMNDGQKLYLALRVPDPTVSWSTAYFYFDNTHDRIDTVGDDV